MSNYYENNPSGISPHNAEEYIQVAMSNAAKALSIVEATLNGSLSISSMGGNPYEKAQAAVQAAESAAAYAEQLVCTQNDAAMSMTDAKNRARISAVEAKNSSHTDKTLSENKARTAKVGRAKDAAQRARSVLEEMSCYLT